MDGFSNLSTFYLSYNSLCKTIDSVWLVLLHERGSEKPGDTLIKAGTGRAKECLYQVIGRGTALSIDKFNEQLALLVGQLLHSWRVFFDNALLYIFHVLLPSLFVGEAVEIVSGLDHNGTYLLGYREYFFYIVD